MPEKNLTNAQAARSRVNLVAFWLLTMGTMGTMSASWAADGTPSHYSPAAAVDSSASELPGSSKTVELLLNLPQQADSAGAQPVPSTQANKKAGSAQPDVAGALNALGGAAGVTMQQGAAGASVNSATAGTTEDVRVQVNAASVSNQAIGSHDATQNRNDYGISQDSWLRSVMIFFRENRWSVAAAAAVCVIAGLVLTRPASSSARRRR